MVCRILSFLENKMKRGFFLFIFFFIAGSAFCLDSQFFKKNPDVEVLYVDSPEGLKVRDNPSLSAKKIDVLYDRMSVKVMSVGAETVIDGIKSNWVKILLPLETIRQKQNVCGWVFGGYLTDKVQVFSTKNWTDTDLKRYLSRFSWVNGIRDYMEFTSEGEYFCGRLESGGGGNGTYTVSMKNKTINVAVSYGDEDYEGPVEKELFKIKQIKEDSLLLEIEGKEVELLPAITNGYFWSMLYRGEFRISDFEEPAMKALFFPFVNDLVSKLSSDRDNEVMWTNLVKMGVTLDSSDYEKYWHFYWIK